MHKRVVVILELAGLCLGVGLLASAGGYFLKKRNMSKRAEVEKEYENICSEVKRLKASICINEDVDLAELIRVDSISRRLGDLYERKEFLETKYKGLIS